MCQSQGAHICLPAKPAKHGRGGVVGVPLGNETLVFCSHLVSEKETAAFCRRGVLLQRGTGHACNHHLRLRSVAELPGTCSQNCSRVLSSASGQTLRLRVDLHRYSVSKRRCHVARKHDFRSPFFAV